MCLLDALVVVERRRDRLPCRQPARPDASAARRGELPAACAIEYAAQAMALHGALRAPAAGQPASGLSGQRARRAPARRRLDDLTRAAAHPRAPARRRRRAQALYRFEVARRARSPAGRWPRHRDVRRIAERAAAAAHPMTSLGKRALVTGASGALGARSRGAWRRDGATCLLHAHRGPTRRRSWRTRSLPPAARPQPSFSTSPTTQPRVRHASAARRTAPVQIIVNNAGMHDDAAFPAHARRQWHRVIDVSLNGFFNVTQPLLLPMCARAGAASSTSRRWRRSSATAAR